MSRKTMYIIGGALTAILVTIWLIWARTFTTVAVIGAQYSGIVLSGTIVVVVAGGMIIWGFTETRQETGETRYSGRPTMRIGYRSRTIGIIGIVLGSVAIIATIVVMVVSGYVAQTMYTANSVSYVAGSEMPELEPRPAYPQASAKIQRNQGNLSGDLIDVSYLPLHADGARWTGIVSGAGMFRPLVGVVEWDHTTDTYTRCEFSGTDSLTGSLWNSLKRELRKETGGWGTLIDDEDVYGACENGEAVLYLPLRRVAGFGFTAVTPGGMATVRDNNQIDIDLDVEPGEYPGPTIPFSVATSVLEANRANDGFGTWWTQMGTYVAAGDVSPTNGETAEDDDDPNIGNVGNFVMKTTDGRVVFVTPLTTYGTSASLTAVAVMDAGHVKNRVMPNVTIYELEQAMPAASEVDQRIRAGFGELGWAAGMRVMEVTPTGETTQIATLGLDMDASYVAEIEGSTICLNDVDTGQLYRCVGANQPGETIPVEGDTGNSETGTLSDVPTVELIQQRDEIQRELDSRLSN